MADARSFSSSVYPYQRTFYTNCGPDPYTEGTAPSIEDHQSLVSPQSSWKTKSTHVSKACANCQKRKTKCSDEWPCERCLSQGRECGPGKPDRRTADVRLQTNTPGAQQLSIRIPELSVAPPHQPFIYHGTVEGPVPAYPTHPLSFISPVSIPSTPPLTSVSSKSGTASSQLLSPFAGTSDSALPFDPSSINLPLRFGPPFGAQPAVLIQKMAHGVGEGPKSAPVLSHAGLSLPWEQSMMVGQQLHWNPSMAHGLHVPQSAIDCPHSLSAADEDMIDICASRALQADIDRYWDGLRYS